MHTAALSNTGVPPCTGGIELIEIRITGKNSADIRLAGRCWSEMCLTKDHDDTFAIAFGDSDFSPLVAKA